MKPTTEELERRISELERTQTKILEALKGANILIPGLNAPAPKGSVYDRADLWPDGTPGQNKQDIPV